MPIHDYVCACGHDFEALVMPGTPAECPECGSTKLERQLSTPSVHSSASHGKAMRSAKARDRSLASDRTHERRRYEESHDRHG
ncbi:MAG: zinc ribbon domain-containing protein [Acidobacteria bacterium]|nr:zinc ribbon domain-containing protein [Acidobacteriota bacterium]